MNILAALLGCLHMFSNEYPRNVTKIILLRFCYNSTPTLSSGTLLGFQFETSEGFDHIDLPALWKTFGTSALRNIVAMLSGMKENRQLITDTAATRESIFTVE